MLHMLKQTNVTQPDPIESLINEVKDLKNLILQSNISQQKAGLSQKQMFNLDEVSLYTGLSKSYIYKQTSGGNMPHFCPSGKILFFEREAIEKWLMSNPVKTNTQIRQEAANYVTLGRRRRKD